jgi:tyrosine-protein kinase Etk/Wzc
MNQAQAVVPEKNDAGSTAGVMGFFIVLAKHKKSIIGYPIAAGVLAIALSFAFPDVYQSRTKMLPPQQGQSGASALLSQLGGMAGAAAGLGGIKNPNDLYVGMLRSRTVAERLIARFNLKQAYDMDSLERTVKRLQDSTVITSGKDGIIVIEVEDLDRERAAKLANGYVDELLRLTKVLAVTDAAQRRVFFERQLETAKNNLSAAEISLKGAIATHGVISVDAESRSVVETVSRLRAQTSAKEVQLNSMQAFVTPNNPEYQRVAQELSSLRSQLAALENGRANATSGQAGITAGGLENIKRLRDVKYYEMLYELLAKQYEIARLDEAKDPAIIQVLDPAVPAERKFKPKRLLLGVLASAVAFFAAVFAAFVRDAKYRMLSSPRGAARWAEFKSYWKN